MPRIAILDDYNHAALSMADWSAVQARCQVDVIDRALAVPDEAARILAPYDALCHLRERTAMPAGLIDVLPDLKMMTITGASHRTLDVNAATQRGILICGAVDRPGGGNGTPELAFGLMLALARKIVKEDGNIRAGRWQSSIGTVLHGKTLGIAGLGKLGTRVARIAAAFGMKVIAWSPNLNAERAAAGGALLVTKDELFAQSDYISMHIVLSERTRHLVGARELNLMKPTAHLINTSRGPLIEEQALLDCLREKRIAGAGLDVYHQEPMGKDHPLYKLENTVLTPHLGYVVEESFRPYYEDTVEAILAWLDRKPVRVINPQALERARYTS
ncbi:MAG: D-2-hydroxyacid dehydrogenase family protein [Alphaproteobacteria bacterium]|nr:D-2-hydroxyacid dehydrogenase family protein [Alphaproteobacteria bacterium]